MLAQTIAVRNQEAAATRPELRRRRRAPRAAALFALWRSIHLKTLPRAATPAATHDFPRSRASNWRQKP